MALAVDFYDGLGSRYAYLASTQLDRIASETGCRFEWRPVARGALMRLRGAFGVPTFFLGARMFWGNDRLILLEHALREAREGGP